VRLAKRRLQDLNLRPQRGTDGIVAPNRWLVRVCHVNHSVKAPVNVVVLKPHMTEQSPERKEGAPGGSQKALELIVRDVAVVTTYWEDQYWCRFVQVGRINLEIPPICGVLRLPMSRKKSPGGRKEQRELGHGKLCTRLWKM
jgi:hypothetical protein